MHILETRTRIEPLRIQNLIHLCFKYEYHVSYC